MTRIERKYEDIEVMAMIPDGDIRSIVYVLEPLKVMPALEKFVNLGTAIISVFGMDWDRDLTPWPAPAVLKKGKDFEGKADEFLRKLTSSIIPETENEAILASRAHKEARRYIVGVSLAGMFAAYATTKSCLFYGIGSVSGSFWYDGFTDYFKTAAPAAEKYYFSIGEREKEAKNLRLASSETCTREIESWLAGKGKQTIFELTPGGHFTAGPERVAKAIEWLML